MAIACEAGMSALGHKADVGAGVGDVRFTHESGHAASHPEMSAKCQDRTLGVAGKRRFDPASSLMVVVMAIGLLVIGVL